MDVSAILEAGLKANDAASHTLDLVSNSLGHLPLAQISSDCCGSNNYPTPQQ